MQSLVDSGVITITDGVVRLTRKAWVQATDGTCYAEDHDTVHFVGFKDDRYHNAVKTFGPPDFVHRFWDHRAVAEVMPGDWVVFADGDGNQPVHPYAYDDSAHF